MEKRIKDSFDHIHAPESLVEDTIRKVHIAQQEEKQRKPYRNMRVFPIAAIVMAAACFGLVFLWKGILGTDISNTQEPSGNIAQLPDDTINAGSMESEEYQTKGQQSWKQVLTQMEEAGETTQNLSEEYVVYEGNFNQEYPFKIILKNGVLSFENGCVIAEGDFYFDIEIAGKSVESPLQIRSTNQFSDEDVKVTTQEAQGEALFQFFVETEYKEEHFSVHTWYTVNQDGTVKS